MDNKFPKGLRAFKPNEKAPDFIISDMVLNKEELINWLSSQPQEVRLQLKRSKENKHYIEINDYKPKGNQSINKKSNDPLDSNFDGDLPF